MLRQLFDNIRLGELSFTTVPLLAPVITLPPSNATVSLAQTRSVELSWAFSLLGFIVLSNLDLDPDNSKAIPHTSVVLSLFS